MTSTSESKYHEGFRTLQKFPSISNRAFLLAIVIIASIVLWYEYYVPTSVAPIVLPHFNMSFAYYVNIIIISNLAGVLAAVIGGIADKVGRANIVVFGLLIVGLMQTFFIPNASSSFMYGLGLILVGLFEGVILVATPALVRDFTPQLGRASAMGFWTLGPVAGVLTASLVETHIISATSVDWQRTFIVSGIAGIVIFVLAAVFLKELSPRLRDQLMVTEKDIELIELKARGLDIETATKNPWRQMLKPEIILSAVAISIMLLIYYTASGFYPIFITTAFHVGTSTFSVQQANGIDTWIWAADCIALIVFGIISDLTKVRKPFMILGAVGALVSMLFLIGATSNAGTGYYTLVLINVFIFSFLAMAYATWMAAFTETVEERNPALAATGLAIWGAILRFVVAASLLLLPIFVDSAGTAVNNQQYANYVPEALQIESKYGNLVAIVQAHQELFNKLGSYSDPTKIPPALIAQGIKAAGGLKVLLEINAIKPQLEFLQKYGTHLLALKSATEKSPNQWKHWFWICFIAIALFIPLIFPMKGRWSPAKARQDEREHREFVEKELARLRAG
jgi:MFS family permease